MRRNSMSSVLASVRPISVLPSPGTPCKSTCPRHNRPIRRKSMISSCPTTTFPISSLTRVRASRRRATTAASSPESVGTAAGEPLAPTPAFSWIRRSTSAAGTGIIGRPHQVMVTRSFVRDGFSFLRVDQPIAVLVDAVEYLARTQKLVPGQIAVVIAIHPLKPDRADRRALLERRRLLRDHLIPRTEQYKAAAQEFNMKISHRVLGRKPLAAAAGHALQRSGRRLHFAHRDAAVAVGVERFKKPAARVVDVDARRGRGWL